MEKDEKSTRFITFEDLTSAFRKKLEKTHDKGLKSQKSSVITSHFTVLFFAAWHFIV